MIPDETIRQVLVERRKKFSDKTTQLLASVSLSDAEKVDKLDIMLFRAIEEARSCALSNSLLEPQMKRWRTISIISLVVIVLVSFTTGSLLVNMSSSSSTPGFTVGVSAIVLGSLAVVLGPYIGWLIYKLGQE